MTSRFAIVPLVLVAALMTAGRSAADEPATTPAATTTTPSTSVPVHKPQATNIINGKVEKITDSSITVKVTFQTMSGGKVLHGHNSPAHMSGGWMPHLVPGHAAKPRVIPGKIHTSVQTMTYQIGDVPPVKVVTYGPKPTRETGTFADVRAGDLVHVGVGPVRTTGTDGKATTRTLVTGIDVLKQPQSSTPSTTKPKK